MPLPLRFKVVRALDDGDDVPSVDRHILCALEPGSTVAARDVYNALGGDIGRPVAPDNRLDVVRKALRHAERVGIAKKIEAKTVSANPFVDIPSVSYWLKTLGTSNAAHNASGGGRGTRYAYLLYLIGFDKWLAGRTWTLGTREKNGDGTYRDVRRDVTVRGVDHLLEMAIERGGLDRGLSLIIREFFVETAASKKYRPGTLSVLHSAIRSYFVAHEVQYGLVLPRSMMRGRFGGAGASAGGDDAGDDDWRDDTLKLSEIYKMLSTGKTTVLDKALLLSKFHRGMDAMTLADRFNYSAFDQITAHMGTDDPQSWNPEKCPVPITLVRPKTSYRHVGFLERDAVAAIAAWLAERERLMRRPMRRGDGQAMYVNRDSRPISTHWVSVRFAKIAVRAGFCRPRKGGGLSPTRRSHQMRHLLKSTLIDSGCRIDVADHVIGHVPKDTYERQATLYPDSLRREYAKAASKINIFTHFEASIDGTDDVHRLRAEMKADTRKLKEVLAEAEAGGVRVAASGSADPMQEKLLAMAEEIRMLKEWRAGGGGGGAGAAAAAAGGTPTGIEYQCISCSLVHSAAQCPACGSAARRIYQPPPREEAVAR